MDHKIKKIRAKTGMPLSQCKRALEECAGNAENAFLLLTLKPDDHTHILEGYRFDRWVDDLSKAISRGTQKRLPSGEHIGLVRIELDDAGLWPLSVQFATLKNEFNFQPYGDWDSASYLIPETADEKDTVLNSFIYRHLRDPLFIAKEFSTYDWLKLPGAIWRYSLICIEEEVKNQLLMSDVPKSGDFDVIITTHGDMVHDEKESILSIIDMFVKDNFHDQTILYDFADLCYEFESTKQWLLAFR